MLKINAIFSKSISKFELFIRLIFYCLLLVISATFIIFIFFLYQRFYLTLAQAEEIVVLKSQLAVDALDLDLYQRVKAGALARQALPAVNWQELPNPFQTINK